MKAFMTLSLCLFLLFALGWAGEKHSEYLPKQRPETRQTLNTDQRQLQDFPPVQISFDFKGGVIWWESFETPRRWARWTSEDLTVPRPEPIPGQWLLDDWEAYEAPSWRCADLTLGNNGGYNNHWYQVLDTPPLLLDEDATLTFYHRYAAEAPAGAPDPYDAWDGLNVRVSDDGGETFTVLPSNTYNVSSIWAFGHPDQGHNEGPGIPGWAGSQMQWTMETFDLSAYTSADKEVIIRFAFASDQAYCTIDDADLFCWQIDNIEVKSASKTFFRNYGSEGEMTGKSNEFIPPPGGDLWHVVRFDDPIPPLMPEFQPQGRYGAACQNSGLVFDHDATYNSYMDNVFSTGPISIPETAPVYLDFKYVPSFFDNDQFPNVDFFRPEVRHADSTEWEWIEPQPYVYAFGFNYWLEFAWTYGYPMNMSMFDLTRFAGEDIYLRFRFWSDYDEPIGKGLVIDDVVIYSPTREIPPPQDVQAEASAEDTTITISWTPTHERVTHFIYRQGPGDQFFYLIGQMTGGSEFVDDTILPFYTYNYIVLDKIKYFGSSAPSDVVSAFVIPEGIVELAYDDSESDGAFDPGRRLKTAVRFTPETYPVSFNTIKIHLDDSEYEQGKGKFYVYGEDPVKGTPGHQLAYQLVSDGLMPGFNIVQFDDEVRIESGSFFVAYERYTRSMTISIDTDLEIDERTYYESSMNNWVVSSEFDAILHVYLNTEPDDIYGVVLNLDENNGAAINEFKLYKNYPNPFNPQTNIAFTIPESAANSNVKLEVFNVLGQKVATLINGAMEAGLHRVQWNGVNDLGEPVNSGVYIYRLHSDRITLTEKMLLIK